MAVVTSQTCRNGWHGTNGKHHNSFLSSSVTEEKVVGDVWGTSNQSSLAQVPPPELVIPTTGVRQGDSLESLCNAGLQNFYTS